MPANEIIKAAGEFKHRCLVEQESLLIESKNVWTNDNFILLKSLINEAASSEKKNFWRVISIFKSRCRFMSAVLMAEIFWITQLCSSNRLPSTKIDQLRFIWECSDKITFEFPYSSPLLSHRILSGVGSFGPGYNKCMILEAKFAIDAFHDFIKMPINIRIELLNSSYDFSKWLDSIPSSKNRQFYHALCYLAFPNAFEPVFSNSKKMKMARALHIWNAELNKDRSLLDAKISTTKNFLKEKDL